MLFGAYWTRTWRGGRQADERRGRYSRRENRDRSSSSDRISSKTQKRKRRARVKRVADKIDKYVLVFAFGLIALRGVTLLRQSSFFGLSFGQSFGIPVSTRDNVVAQNLGSRLAHLSVEIFSAPKPFLGTDKDLNRRAIESWLKLKPRPKVTLLGNETGYEEAAREFGLNLEAQVDKTFLGVPLFNSMIDRANKSDSTIAVLINGDIILTDDFMQTVKKTVFSVQDFLLIAARYDIDGIPTVDTRGLHSLRNHVVSNGRLHTYGGMDLWAWNPRGPRLFGPNMPHFIFGRGKYDNWMTHEAIAAGNRVVIDASETCLLVHVRHDYHLVQGGEGHGSQSEGHHVGRKLQGTQFWSEGKLSKFELFTNIFLSLSVGSYVNQMGSVLYAPWKLGRCAEKGGMCFTRRVRPGMCPCEYSSFTSETQTDPSVRPGSRVIQCGMLSSETKSSFQIPVRPPSDESVEPESFGLPLTIRSVSEKVAQNGTILLTALTHGYRNMMMNWVCNMRELGMSNMVIAALDEPLYTYAFTRGLPVYYENTVDSSNVGAGAAYGSTTFKKITKAKSRVVVRFLKLGYNVVWSDCDIIFFKNPIQYMWEQNADIVIQTNAPDDEPLNGKRRLNSGFYLARSTPQVISAFEDVIDYARQSTMSEQPCFYDVLCGKQGENAMGTTGCSYKGVYVSVLARELFPNGVTHGMWDIENGKILEKHPSLYMLHNNWVKGSAGKRARFERHGMVTFDEDTELCTYDSVAARALRRARA